MNELAIHRLREAEKDLQRRFLDGVGEWHVDNGVAFEAMSDNVRRRYVKNVAVEKIREASPLPLITDGMQWTEAVRLAASMYEERPTDEREEFRWAMAEAGLTHADPGASVPLTRTEAEEFATMREAAGLPVHPGPMEMSWQAALADSGLHVPGYEPEPPPTYHFRAALHECGLPPVERTFSVGHDGLSEAAALLVRLAESGLPPAIRAASTLPADEIVPVHEVVARLDEVLDDDHPDKEIVRRLRIKGAALNRAETGEAMELGRRHPRWQLVPPSAGSGWIAEASTQTSADTDADGDLCPTCGGEGILGGVICGDCGGSGWADDGQPATPSSLSGQRRAKVSSDRSTATDTDYPPGPRENRRTLANPVDVQRESAGTLREAMAEVERGFGAEPVSFAQALEEVGLGAGG
jgi:hypothetical protein